MIVAKRRRRKVILGGIIFTSFIMTFGNVYLKDNNILSRPGLRSFLQQGERTNIRVLIQPKLKCDQGTDRTTVITVLSTPSNFQQRQVIRQTWGSVKMQVKYSFILFFVIGKVADTISLGNDLYYEDIIQVDIEDNYYNLAEKTIAAFKWVTDFCFEPVFFFKMDDDVYFDLEFLDAIKNDDSFLLDDVIHGTCVRGVPPYRQNDPEGFKFQVTIDEYHFSNYPPFCGGPGYFMTLYTAKQMYFTMKTTRTFKFEDVYVGMVAYLSHISVKTIENFVYEKKKAATLLQEVKVKGFRVVHGLTHDDVWYLWESRHLA